MNVCKKLNIETEFKNFEHQRVIFSGDTIPICPICKMSPYEKDYAQFHEQMEVEE